MYSAAISVTVPSAAWPMIAPCFALHAEDDHGNGYEGTLAGFGPGSGLEAKGTFWLWPTPTTLRPRHCSRSPLLCMTSPTTTS